MIEEKLNQVKKNIAAACRRVGRSPDDVTLIAVSKTKPIDVLQEAYDAGVRIFGENKVQELTQKYPKLPGDISWHFIGHLQRNKVKYIVDKATLIHSVDSIRLAAAIDKEAGSIGRIVPVLLEVNAAEEDSKFGILPQDLMDTTIEIAKYPNIHIEGLMIVAPFVEKAEENRIHFQKLMKLYVDIKSKNIDNVNMCILSMGMTGDYEVAVEEGATMVRVGTGIFGERIYPNALT